MKRYFIVSILLVIILACLAGCNPAPSIVEAFSPAKATFTPFIPVTWTPTPAVTATHTIMPSPTFTPLPSPTFTSTPFICREVHGKIERLEEEDGSPDQPPLTFRIYKPPCYGEVPGKTYPVLYIIHGQSFTDDQWDRLGIDEVADRLIASEQASPFLIVMPLEENTWPDPFETRFGFTLSDELVPWIDQHYATCAERSCRAIGGLSRGGGWAIHMGFTRWDLYGAIGAHSTPVFLSDPYRLPAWLKEIPQDQWPRIYMDIGKSDYFIQYAQEFEVLLTQYQVPHEYHLNEGTHNEEYWSQHVEEYLRWYTQAW